MKISVGTVSLSLAGLTLIVGTVTWLENHFHRLETRLDKLEAGLVVAIDRHEEFVSVEHGDIGRSISTAQDDFRAELGFHRGQHHGDDHE